jgi:hypothetical protein
MDDSNKMTLFVYIRLTTCVRRVRSHPVAGIERRSNAGEPGNSCMTLATRRLLTA